MPKGKRRNDEPSAVKQTVQALEFMRLLHENQGNLLTAHKAYNRSRTGKLYGGCIFMKNAIVMGDTQLTFTDPHHRQHKISTHLPYPAMVF